MPAYRGRKTADRTSSRAIQRRNSRPRSENGVTDAGCRIPAFRRRVLAGPKYYLYGKDTVHHPYWPRP
jgi:hypothetical protein